MRAFILPASVLICLAAACKSKEPEEIGLAMSNDQIQQCHYNQGWTWDTAKVIKSLTGRWILQRKSCPAHGGEVAVLSKVKLDIRANQSVQLYVGDSLLQTAVWQVDSLEPLYYQYASPAYQITTFPKIEWMAGRVFICNSNILFSDAYDYYRPSGSPPGCDHFFRREN